MPKLPLVSGKECRKALGKLGFEEARQRDSHVVMKRGEGGCVVPMHAEIKTGISRGYSSSRA
jgi:predicted RNA binding protein YcfA (HicA-like mRNA interferase family)